MVSLPVVDSPAYPTSDELLAQTLNDIRYGYAAVGLPANVEVGGDHYFRARAFNRRLAIAIANNKLANDNRNPLTAKGDELIELAGVHGVRPRPASSAAGFVIAKVTGGGTVTVPQGYPWIAPNGQSYHVITATTVADGEPVEVSADDTGTKTNQVSGTVGLWGLASLANLKQEAAVDVDAIDGGVEADDEEKLRQRLLRRLAFPEVGGTPAQIATWAEEASAAIEQAFVHPAARGPASYDVVVIKAGGNRALAPSIVAAAKANILANMPGHADVNATTVDAEYVDIVVNATLPLPKSVGGAGGGWRDTNPWPSTADATLAKVTAKTSSTLTVNSTSADAPSVGKRFGIWDPTDEVMLEFTIQSVSGGSGAYVVTPDPAVSSTLTNVQVGAYVSAGAVQLTDYADELNDEVLDLGPGEKSSLGAILRWARRQPGPDVEAPNTLTHLQLCEVTEAHAEVLDLDYAARYATGTTTTLTSPSTPATTADPTKVLVPKFIAFRRKVT